jgi:hydroxymethylglutaryl-CoA lyase
MTERIRIVEVGPRDGLQNEKTHVPVDIKVAYIERLLAAGLTNIEAGSFVSPKWVPQMADTGEVLRRARFRDDSVVSVLLPNMVGLNATPFDIVDEINVFTAATESFSKRNTNGTIDEVIARFVPVFQAAHAAGKTCRASISVFAGCPYEGEVSPGQVADVTEKLLAIGADEIVLGDTIGAATPARLKETLRAVLGLTPASTVALHFHDTFGTALANCVVGLEAGIRTYEGAAGGLGGCPYAPGATGNVATEDLVYFMKKEGLATGVELADLVQTGHWIATALGRPYGSRVGNALRAKAAN